MSHFKNTYDPEMGFSYNDMNNFQIKILEKALLEKFILC